MGLEGTVDQKSDEKKMKLERMVEWDCKEKRKGLMNGRLEL